MVMEITKCPACLSMHLGEFLKLNKSRRSRFVDFSQKYYNGLLEKWLNHIEPFLMNCRDCSHVFYKFVPEDSELSEMYLSRVRSKDSLAPNRPPSNYMINEMYRMLKLIGKQKPKFLDYGSGYRRWSQAAMEVGFDVVAYEPHPTLNSVDSRIELVHSLVALKSQKFDLIWLEQVLEHVPNPQNVLRQTKEFMCKGSVLRMTVPNINKAPEGRNIWNEWPYNGESHHTMTPYQHLHGFSHRSLSALCSSLGYKNSRCLNVYKQDILHQFRIILGKYIDFLSTTKRYLTLPDNQTS